MTSRRPCSTRAWLRDALRDHQRRLCHHGPRRRATTRRRSTLATTGAARGGRACRRSARLPLSAVGAALVAPASAVSGDPLAILRTTMRRPRPDYSAGAVGPRKARARLNAARKGEADARRTHCPGRHPRCGLRRCRRASPPGVLTRVKPRPNPLRVRSSDVSTCANISKIRPSWSAAMPMPVSRTRRTACAPSVRP